MSETVDPRLTQLRAKISQFPKTPGVYLMKNKEGIVLYVGKARDLRSRVGSYFQESAALLTSRGPWLVQMIAQVEASVLNCDLKESRLIKDIQPPYNTQQKDQKTFPYLEITVQDDFPGVYVTRQPRQGSKLYGPFTTPSGLRDAVNTLQRIFKFRTCELEIHADDDKRRFFRPCLLHAIDQCSAPCAAAITPEAYAADIQRLKKLLGTRRSVLLRSLQREMEQAAQERKYEDAAVLRDRIKAIESLDLSGDVDEDMQPEVFYIDPAEGLERLRTLLELPERPRIIEGLDIATLHGEDSVGSLVCFIDGKPFKGGYRRFKIKTVGGIDDYAMIKEVIARRYRYAAAAEELYPDVILIDGGLGQLHAALEAFEHMRRAIETDGGHAVRPAMVISLAKREELVYAQARSEPLRLPRNDAALRILQYVRDEAHRFGQHYHHILRRKRTFEEELATGRRPPPAKKRKPKKGEVVLEEDEAPPPDESNES